MNKTIAAIHFTAQIVAVFFVSESGGLKHWSCRMGASFTGTKETREVDIRNNGERVSKAVARRMFRANWDAKKAMREFPHETD